MEKENIVMKQESGQQDWLQKMIDSSLEKRIKAGDVDYEEVIRGVDCGRTGLDKLIQRLTLDDPAAVLAIIGLDHPAAPTVFKYLADKKYEEFEKNGYPAFYAKSFLMRNIH